MKMFKNDLKVELKYDLFFSKLNLFIRSHEAIFVCLKIVNLIRVFVDNKSELFGEIFDISSFLELYNFSRIYLYEIEKRIISINRSSRHDLYTVEKCA